jgi:hypothetical protein
LAPRGRISKCRCGPLAGPVALTRAICAPAATEAPRRPCIARSAWRETARRCFGSHWARGTATVGPSHPRRLRGRPSRRPAQPVLRQPPTRRLGHRSVTAIADERPSGAPGLARATSDPTNGQRRHDSENRPPAVTPGIACKPQVWARVVSNHRPLACVAHARHGAIARTPCIHWPWVRRARPRASSESSVIGRVWPNDWPNGGLGGPAGP